MSVGLVLEGGGMRGSYTAGVLSAFEDNDVYFPSIYGISAGACNALSYISGQSYRNHDIFYQYVQGDKYVSVKNFIKHGCMFDFDYIFGDLFHTILPFDYEAFKKSSVKFYAGATDIQTGLPVFFTKDDMDERMDVIRASSSLPFLSNIIKVGNYKLLDGGISMPIPVERSICDGNEYNVIVLTRDAKYKKSAKPEFPQALMKAKYHKYPALLKALNKRADIYNEQRLFCQKLEKKKKAIGDNASFKNENQKKIYVYTFGQGRIGVTTNEKQKMETIYDMGYTDAMKRMNEIKAMIAEHSTQTVSVEG